MHYLTSQENPDLADEARILLLKYEDVKSMYIHQSGPVAENITSHQLGTMLGKEGFGVHAKDGVKKYAYRSPEEIEKTIDKELKKYKEEWKLTDAQNEIMVPLIREIETKRWYHANETGKWMRKTQEMLDAGKNNEELFEAARKLFYNHKMYVYWLSDFNTPKWHLWLDVVKAPPGSVAKEFLNARDDNYILENYEKELQEIKEVYWYPPILYVNPNLTDVPLNGFGDRGLPFVNIEDAIKVASDGTEIRVAGKIDKSKIDLGGKKISISDGYNSNFNEKQQPGTSTTSSVKKKKDKNDPSEIAKKADKKKENALKDLDPKANLDLLNQWGEQPEPVNKLYKKAYEIFASKPLDATYSDLAKDVTFQQLCKQNGLDHLGGPMLGNIKPTGATIWIRTLQPAKVEVQITIDGKEKLLGPVNSTIESDLVAIVSVTGLNPKSSYPYKILVDGKSVVIAENATINTPLMRECLQKSGLLLEPVFTEK